MRIDWYFTLTGFWAVKVDQVICFKSIQRTCRNSQAV